MIPTAQPRSSTTTEAVCKLREALGGAALLGFRTAEASAPFEQKAAFVGFTNTYTVTSTADDGSAGTLRYEVGQATQDAANNNNFDAVVFDQSIAGQTINLTSPLTITQSMIIDGSGASAPTTINGNGTFTDVVVNPGSGKNVYLYNLALNNGHGTGTTGTNGTTGGSDANAANGAKGGDAAGGIFVQSGVVSLNNVAFANDSATGGTGGQGGNYRAATSSNNSPPTKGAGGAGGNAAGAVYVEPGATVSYVNRLTATNTTAQGGTGGPQLFSSTPNGAPGTGDPVSNNQTVRDNTTTCYVSGTLIRTAHRDVAVEDLAIGDLAITATGALRPITWIGHRTIDCRNHPRRDETMPIRIAAQAFGDNRPSRDLFVSPGHAICVDALSEVLIPAAALVNGSTIRQIDVDTVTYWHVELDSHDVILAENLPAESYLDMGNRDFFAEGAVVALTASPDADPSQRTHADFCRPFVDGGPILEAVRLLLRQRAEALGWRATDALDMHLVVDGQRLDPVVRGLTARFHVPAEAKDVWLVSPTARPSDAATGDDGRDLGLYIGGLRIDDGFAARDVAIDDPLLCIGFHAVEDGARRWTSGRARLPAALWEGCEGGFYLRIELAGRPVPRWTATAAGAERQRLAIVA